MKPFAKSFDTFDTTLTRWTARHAVPLLRVSVGVVFLWFGFLKFFPGGRGVVAAVGDQDTAVDLPVVPDQIGLRQPDTGEQHLVGIRDLHRDNLSERTAGRR